MKNKNVMRSELPNPAFARQNWRTLNGTWEFAFDHDNKYEKMSIDSVPFDREIQVPFCYRTKLSGINAVRDCQNVWYRRGITVTKEELAGSVLLHFGAVDYCAKVWINGVFAGSHMGGHTPFYFDIAPFLKPGDKNVLVVKAEDSYSMDQPRGKQMWGPENTLCWYDNTVGIWQSVWLEFTGKAYLTHIRITPYLDRNLAHFEVQSNSDEPLTVLATVSKEEKTLGTMSVEAPAGRTDMIFTFEEFAARAVLDLYWSPESPVLIDVELKLMQGDQVLDTVATYFGMRKIHTDGDRVFLNNQLLYQRLVLDQGYWPEGLMTAPSDEAIRLDVEMAKSMGFNGVRKHQKIEDPRFYYWADRMGLLVWGELPSAYEFTYRSRGALLQEMHEFIERDYNHPCIIQWVPMNESWGTTQVADDVQQQNFLRALYYRIKAEDPTRLVCSNDGWEQIDTTDICGIHDYAVTPQNCANRYSELDDVLRGSVNCRPVYSRGFRYNGIPILITEMGGVKLKNTAGWGYAEDLANSDAMVDYLRKLMYGLRGISRLRGFCYTQLTDVMQETNGLLTDTRKPKVPVEVLREIFG